MSGGPNDLNLPNDVNLTGVLEDLPLPLLVLDVSSHKILWTNANAEVWLGRSRRALIGRDLGFITDDLAALILPLSRVSEISGVVNAYDFLIKRPNGNVSKCQMTAYYFTGAFDGAIALYFREQDSKRPENLSEKNSDAVGALGRMLAHELKNPLSGIKGAAQLLASDASSAEDRELIALISTETDRIRRLADRMESFGDFDLKRRGPVNIHAILRQARLLAQSSTQAGLVFSEIYDPSLPLVDGDNDALMQVAINLIVNATEAMTSASTGREIRLETAYRSGLHRQSAGRASPVALPIEVRFVDDGPGIPAHMQGQIFQPFVTDKPAGRGLGLTLVSKIIAAHGGVIDVKSRPGRTVFSLYLPAHIAKEPSDER